MKNLLLIFGAVLMFAATSCNTAIEWNDDMVAQFKKKCLDDMAGQFKAENPDEFCTCFVDKMKEKEMGMMDMIKESVGIAEECGAKMPQKN